MLVSPQRAQRPWLGQVERTPAEFLPAYDPSCYLCPGNERAGGKRNPNYTGTFVFNNDFPSLLTPDGQEVEAEHLAADGRLFVAEPMYGINRVVCFSPRHDLTLPELDQMAVEAVVRTWAEETRELGSKDFIRYVQVFENKGAMMGCSNPHPHSQIWATSKLPNEPEKELGKQRAYLREHGDCLLCDYAEEEQRQEERIIISNEHFVALVPFWAIWPFEVMLLPKRHIGWLTELDGEEIVALADILGRLTRRYDNLFETSFPYSMGFHQAPFHEGNLEGWHLHAHYYPPLLRSATVRKFMVGFEMLGMPQRDLTPEAAAERLRAVSEVHYLGRAGHE